mgnify:FL=1
MENDKFEQMLDEDQANAVLEKGMLYADAFVNKNYLINLDRYPLVELDPAEKSDEYLRLYQIERIVYDVDENANDKLISVYSAFFNIQAAGLLIIQSTRHELGFYLGIRSVYNASTAEAILEKSFKGNFAGSQIIAVPQEKLKKVLGSINKSGRFGNCQNVASVSIIPSARDEDKERFVQGIEKFIDTMKGSEYTAVFIAEPLDKEILEQRKRGLQKIFSGLSPFASTQLSYGENYSKAVSKGMSENFSKTFNDSLTDTTSHFKSRSTSHSHGHSFGFLGIGFNSSNSTGCSTGSSWASAVTRGTSETKGETITETDTDTTGDSRTITVTSENKSVKYILERIDQHLARIKNCEAFGLWDIACYFVSENVQTSVVAASTYKALMAGFDSGVENSYVNVWTQDNVENTPAVLEYLRYCIHPRFIIPGDDQIFEIESQTVNPCSLISGNEMPFIMGLPRHSVPGVTVLNMAEFGRNVRFSSGTPRGKKVELGQVYHMGEKEPARVKLDLESFRSHCFITGSTGSGKSNTTYRILDEMIEYDIPFLVVEPAKGEYKRYYGKLPNIHVYCTNPRFYSMLHINPFRFNQGIHVLEHLDRLIEIFNACWPLYAAMPAILKESFERAYVKCGWDLEKSIYIPNGHSKFPTFNDVLEALPEIINSSSYSADSKGDYTGALVTRVKSLTNGISGQVLCSANDIDEEYLFDQNTIVDLSRVASLETKSLLMGVLILKLNEYRMCTSEENQPLRHITVMEEAHNILKRSASGGSEGSDVQAKSVEMISSAIAEMRTYGEGFIIVDQSPTAVDVSAIKNTNTKIIMRLPDYEDCKIAGLSMGLNDSQIREISRFPMGVAVVYQNNWVEAVLTQIDKSEEQYRQGDLITDDYTLAVIKGRLTVELILQFETGFAGENGFELDDLLEIINNSEINSAKKQELVQVMVDWCSSFEREAPRNGSFSAKLADLISCDGLFEALPIRFSRDYKDEIKITRDCIDKKDLRSIKEWFERVYDHLDSYVLLTDITIKKRTLRYLLFNKRIKGIDHNKYQLIYEGIYGKVKGNI